MFCFNIIILHSHIKSMQVVCSTHGLIISYKLKCDRDIMHGGKLNKKILLS